MKSVADKVVAKAMGLSPALRAFVAEKLIESLDATAGPKLSPQWKREIRRRCAEIDQGSVRMRSSEKVFKRARAALG